MSQLSLIATPAHDELLSSWLDRTANLHGVRRHHLLEWSGYRGRTGRQLDQVVNETDIAIIARMMRSGKSEIYARTHTWLGCLRDDVICRARAPVSCQCCADSLQMCHGAQVRLKHWTEAWRIRCIVCGDILSQEREEAFSRELDWHWYEAVIIAADRGSTVVANAIGRQRSPENHPGEVPAQLVRHNSTSLVPADVLWLFGLDGTDPRCPNTLSRLSLTERLFLLAAVGARRPSEAEWARHLLRVWLQNRRLVRQTSMRRRQRSAGSSFKINVNLRLGPGRSQIKPSTLTSAYSQSQN